MGNYGIFLIMGHAGFISSTVFIPMLLKKYLCDFHAHTFYNVALQHAVLLLQTEVLEFWGFNLRAPSVGFL